MRTSPLAALAAAAVLLTACTPTTGGSTAPSGSPAASGSQAPSGQGSTGTGSSGTPTVAPPSPGEQEKIKDIDFATLAWQDVHAPKLTISLAKGPFTSGEKTWSLGENKVYADADGDGYLDAMVDLVVKGPKITTTYPYIWLWDPATGKPKQLVDPVGRYSTCDDSFVSAAPDQVQGFTISTRIRDVWDHSKCGTTPRHPFTRTVTIDRGMLLMTAPVLGYGGVCQSTYNGYSEMDPKITVYAAPNEDSTPIAEADQVFFEMPDYSDRTWPKGWRLVTWVSEEFRKNKMLYGICGFVNER